MFSRCSGTIENALKHQRSSNGPNVTTADIFSQSPAANARQSSTTINMTIQSQESQEPTAPAATAESATMESMIGASSSDKPTISTTLEVGTPTAHENDASPSTQGPEEPTMELTEEQVQQRKRACCQKIAVALVLVAIIVFVVVDSLTIMNVRNGVNSFLEWIQNNPGPGVVVFALVYFVATILFIPGSILTLGSGFVFSASFGLGIGVLLGTLAVFVGASAGAIASFLLGRYLMRDCVSKLSKKYSIFEALDNALASKGLRIMVLLRLSPIIPFNAINYIAGVSALKFLPYLWSLFAILPGTILYVFLGASASSLTDSAMGDDNSTVTIVVIVLGVFFGFIAIALTSYYARHELNKVVAKRQAELEAGTCQDEANDAEQDHPDDNNEDNDVELGQVNQNEMPNDDTHQDEHELVAVQL